MDKEMSEIEKAIKEQFLTTSEGTIERLEERVERLENAVAHLMAFLIVSEKKFGVSFDRQDGINDW